MKKIIYEGKSGFFEETIYYDVINGEFTITNISKCNNKKEALFKDDTECSYKLNQKETTKLFNLLTEAEIKEKFGVEMGYLDFKDYCEKNKIDYKFIGNFD